MTSWLVASPSLVDHTFPRTKADLQMARKAVFALDELLRANTHQLVMTPNLAELLSLVEWEGTSLGETYDLKRMIDELLLVPAGRTVTVLYEKTGTAPYPTPACATKSDYVDVWAEEVGELAELCACSEVDSPFAGVACSSSFAGGPKCHTAPLRGSHCLVPLISSTEALSLESAYEPVYDDAAIRGPIPLSAVRRHWRQLGAKRLRPASGSSHVDMLEFDGRTWPLDVNDDPVPDNNLRTLVRCCNLPKKWVKTVLLTGAPPTLQPRISRSVRVKGCA